MTPLLWTLLAAVAVLAIGGASLATRSGAVVARALLRPLVRAVYAVRVEGAQHVPRSGGALIVANHVSYADAFLLASCFDRPLRFLMHRSFFERPVMGAFARWVGAIPVASGDTRAARREALESASAAIARGELVAIFAEGRITRTGNLLGFRKGLETIARAAGAPIVPAALDEVWGSIFSFAGGRALWKWPRHLPYRVGVSFGAALPSDATSARVRDAIGELLARAAEARALRRPDLARSFVGSARRHARRTALVDGRGTRLTYRSLLAGSLLAARELDRRLGAASRVGVLLPPGAGGALANLAAALAGRTVVDLNYSAGPEAVAGAVRRAGLTHVIGARRFLEALGWTVAESHGGAAPIEVEELPARAGRLARLGILAATWLPAAWIAWLLPRRARASDPVAILFSSGSSAAPKGVVLTHAGVRANARALAQVAELSEEDRVLGVLPFFHAFGYTVTLWAPLLRGARAVYHADPFDAGGVARLARREGATVALGTPAMLQVWSRRIEREDLATLRLAISGAQRLPRALAEAWRARFGRELHEGYGATELSPVVSVDLPDVERGGMRQRNHAPCTVGRPLPGVAVRVVGIEDGQPCAPGEAGRLLVRGPNVMQGYLDDPQATGAVLRDGWYDTDDVGSLDRDGFLSITDRLGRFTKVGGEMLSHASVEEVLQDALAALAETREGGGELAVVGVDDARRGERLVLVHTPLPVAPEALIERALADGAPALHLPRAADCFEVEALPVLGSGKLDLRALRTLAQEAFGGRAPLPGARADEGAARGAPR